MGTFGGKTILITGARAPVSLHLARLLHDAGARIILADTFKHVVAAASRCCDTYCVLSPPRHEFAAYGQAITDLVRREGIDLVIPTCEEVFYLAQLKRDGTLAAPLFAPDFDLLAEVHDKHAFIELCLRTGIDVPGTMKVTSRDELVRFKPRSRDMVFKPVWSRFASAVRIRPDASELDEIQPTQASPWVAQDHVAGDEISAYAVARDGTVKALALYRSLYRAGKGAGVCFEPVSDAAAETLVETFVAATRWTGQISFDLMREPSGRILPLECNPRATSGVHFFARPDAFADAMSGDGSAIQPDVQAVCGVPLALDLYGLGPALVGGHLREFFATRRAMQDVFDWPGDRLGKYVQLRALAEIAGVAMRQRTSLQSASTQDIEWNGDDQSSI